MEENRGIPRLEFPRYLVFGATALSPVARHDWQPLPVDGRQLIPEWDELET
jgi:hypothetical protein